MKGTVAQDVHKSKTKCRTNRGKFMHLEARYWNGDLTGQEEERYERLCLDLSRLYREAHS